MQAVWVCLLPTGAHRRAQEELRRGDGEAGLLHAAVEARRDDAGRHHGRLGAADAGGEVPGDDLLLHRPQTTHQRLLTAGDRLFEATTLLSELADGQRLQRVGRGQRFPFLGRTVTVESQPADFGKSRTPLRHP